MPHSTVLDYNTVRLHCSLHLIKLFVIWILIMEEDDALALDPIEPSSSPWYSLVCKRLEMGTTFQNCDHVELRSKQWVVTGLSNLSQTTSSSSSRLNLVDFCIFLPNIVSYFISVCRRPNKVKKTKEEKKRKKKKGRRVKIRVESAHLGVAGL